MLTVSPRTVSRVAWGVLGYTILVVLWGAFVRASGSGAGCGDHWPLCNGEVVPTAPTLNTIVEFGHRVTSALAGLAALLFVVVAFRGTSKGSPVRKAAVATLAFMVLEGGIGAALVLFEYVAYNPSIGRAIWMAAHLTNTFLLMGALTLTAWWSEGMATPHLGLRPGGGGWARRSSPRSSWAPAARSRRSATHSCSAAGSTRPPIPSSPPCSVPASSTRRWRS